MTGFDYDTLVGAKSVEGSIKWWANHARVPSAQILTEAQSWIYARIRVWDMIATKSVIIGEGTESFLLPDDFQSVVYLRLDGDVNPLPFVHENFDKRYRDQTTGDLISSRPSQWANLGGRASFDCTADDDYAGALVYYATPADLTSSGDINPNPTNWLTRKYPSILRLVCTGLAFQDRKRHAEAIDYFKLAEIESNNINQGDDLARATQILR